MRGTTAAGSSASAGFYLVCTLVAALNPTDLDALDESVPFTKNRTSGAVP
jgi:hypothetical protein